MLQAEQMLIRSLETLAATMRRVAADHGELRMERWITDVPGNDDHWCGAAACICGYQALAMDADIFPLDEYAKTSLQAYADRISDILDIQCNAVFGNICLAKSIYGGDADERLHCARFINIHREPDFFIDDPTPEAAERYIQSCIAYVKTHAAERIAKSKAAETP